MKSKIPKILGVALALVLTLSLVGAILPANQAQAATLRWSVLPTPSVAGLVIVPATSEITNIVVSPNFANDNTVFCTAWEPVTAGHYVYKSIDGGHKWVQSGTNLGAVAPVALVVSPDYAIDSTVFVATPAATGGTVLRSTNGGASFSAIGSPVGAAADRITSMAIALDYSSGIGSVAVGMATNIAGVSANGVWVWGFAGNQNWTSWPLGPNPPLAEDVTTVAFSSNYPLDSTILAVGSSPAGTRLHTIVGTNVWDATVAPPGPYVVNAAILDWFDAGVVGIIASSLAMPSDFNGTVATSIRAYVSTVSETAANDDVYRLSGGAATVRLTAPDSDNVTPGVQRQYGSLGFSGDFTAGTLYAGRYGTVVGVTANVARCINPTASAAWQWYNAVNAPSGTTIAAGRSTTISLTSDFATSNTMFAGTVGTDSAVAITKNGAVHFNETGMIDTVLNTIRDVQPINADTIFLVTTNAGALVDSLWRTTNGGSMWERIDWRVLAPNNGIVRPSQTYATSNVVYWGELGGTATRYSANGGDGWSTRVAPVAVGDIVAPDATTLYVANFAAGNVVKSFNAGWTWLPPRGTGTGAVNDMAVLGSDVLIGGVGGRVSRSTDGGTSFTPVGPAIGGAGLTWVAFDAAFDTNSTILATEAAGNAYRWVLGTDVRWTPIDLAPSGVSVGMAVADDGTLYQADPTVVTALVGGIRRSLNPLAAMVPRPPTFEWVANAQGLTLTYTLVTIAEADNALFCVENSGGAGANRVLAFDDTLSAGQPGPTLNLPVDGSVLTLANVSTFNWNAVAGATGYDLWYDTSSTWGTATRVVTVLGGTTVRAALPTDLPYYWRVRVTLGGPVRGAWSETWKVIPQLVTAVNSPAQQNPNPANMTHRDVALQPTFNWSALLWATKYQIQVANDSAFSDMIADETLGAVTSWQLPTKLDYSTSYYWRVKAMSAASTTDWSAGVGFTTIAPPPPPPPPPPAPAPAPIVEVTEITPGWIWAIIAIGAVLVIAVLILIVRTRRVV